MIPNQTLRVVESKGVEDTAAFGISLKDSSFIMKVLRDQIYSDKVLAVLREYSSNAWDAHREAGKADVPIKVTLPTKMDPTLTIRDFGKGLSREEVFTVFSQYGASTKRNNDNSVGMLGIGSKSGFAYSDSFTILSYNGGMKRAYVAVIDPSETGFINLLHEEPSDEETGLEIRVAIRPEDIEEFRTKALSVYRYFVPRPDINETIPELPTTLHNLKSGVIYDHRSVEWAYRGWVAVMGCISYKIDLDELENFEGGIPGYISSISGALYFKIGEIEINASREALKYNAETKRALVERFNSLVEEYVVHTLGDIERVASTPWEKRVRAQVLRRLNLPIPRQCEDITSGYVTVKDKIPKGLVLWVGKQEGVTQVSIEEKTRFIIRDELKRTLKGYNLGAHDYVVDREDKKEPIDNVKKALDEMLKERGLEGVKVELLSSLQWTPSLRSLRPANVKHKMKVFKLVPQSYVGKRLSDWWEPVELTPGSGDVFVVLSHFDPIGVKINFYERYQEDAKLAKHFGAVMPEVFGYKTTEKKPVGIEDCLGTHYPEWSDNFIKSLLTPNTRQILKDWQWSKGFKDEEMWQWGNEKWERGVLTRLQHILDPNHLITRQVERIFNARARFRDNKELVDALDLLVERGKINLGTPEVDSVLEDIEKKYPLLGLAQIGVEELWGNNHREWAQYVNEVDIINTLY